MLSVEEAQRKLLALARALPSERISIEEAAGRVLAEDIDATSDVPAFSSSTMDGYAVRAADLPRTLPVVGESRAGGGAAALAAASAARIFTGAQLPAGADAVVPQESVVRDGDRARFDSSVKAGAFVRARASDLAQGARAIDRGTRITPGHAGLIAMLDRAWIEVARRPVVTVLSTGDEIRAPGQPGRVGSIPDSSGVAVRALLRGAGAIVRAAGHVRDDRADTEAALRAALRGTDVLVTVGGVSVGDHDLVRPALAAVGVALDFWRVAMKPGKPVAVGTLRDTIVLGLPGNPASAVVSLAIFGLPLLRALAGRRDPLPRPLRARLSASASHDTGRLELARATLTTVDGHLVATILPNQSSGALTSLAAADGLVVLPAELATFGSGTDVDVYPWSELVS